jgi:hypothetical protein
VDASAITEGHHKPDPRPSDGGRAGMAQRETDLRSGTEAILIDISPKSNDHILKSAARAILSGIRVYYPRSAPDGMISSSRICRVDWASHVIGCWLPSLSLNGRFKMGEPAPTCGREINFSISLLFLVLTQRFCLSPRLSCVKDDRDAKNHKI